MKSRRRIDATTTIVLAEREVARVDVDAGALVAPPQRATRAGGGNPWRAFPPITIAGLRVAAGGLGVGAVTGAWRSATKA